MQNETKVSLFVEFFRLAISLIFRYRMIQLGLGNNTDTCLFVQTVFGNTQEIACRDGQSMLVSNGQLYLEAVTAEKLKQEELLKNKNNTIR